MYKLFLDIGSLKIKALVFDENNQQIKKITKTINLAENISHSYLVSDEKIIEFKNALLEIKLEITNQLNSSTVFITVATGTEAVRKISNLETLNNVLNQLFQVKAIEIISQKTEGDMFFEVVAKNFSNQNITTIDIGGGSVQVRSGVFNGEVFEIKNSVNLTTGCSTLKQYVNKQSWNEGEVISNLINYLLEKINNINWKSDVVVFGSNCMVDFIKVVEQSYISEEIIKYHPIYTTIDNLQVIFDQTSLIPLPQRCELWSANPGFMYDSDYVFSNLITISKKVKATKIYPTNLSYILGFIN